MISYYWKNLLFPLPLHPLCSYHQALFCTTSLIVDLWFKSWFQHTLHSLPPRVVLPQLCLVTTVSQLVFLIPPSLPPYVTLTSLDLDSFLISHSSRIHTTDRSQLVSGWQCQSPLFLQWVPNTDCLQLHKIAVSSHQSSTVLYFLGLVKTSVSTQTLGVTVS